MLGAGAAQAQTSVTLVSNTGQSQDTASPISVDRGQAFTTGSNSDGYTVTGVDLLISDGSVSSTNLPMSITSSSTSNRPSAVKGTLSTMGGTGTVSYTTTGIVLQPNTTYFVLLEGPNVSTVKYGRTNSDSEDAGGAEGWSINDGSVYRGNSGDAWEVSDSSLQMTIHGRPNSRAPSFSRVWLDDSAIPKRIKLEFSEAVNGCPSRSAMPIHADGARRWQGAYKVVCADRTVALYLRYPSDWAATANYLTVGYDKSLATFPSGGSRLTYASDGAEVSSISDVPVNGHSTRVVPAATVDGTTMTLTFARPLKVDSAPAGRAFTVWAQHTGGPGIRRCVGSCRVEVQGSAAISGARARLTLAEVVPKGATVLFDYRQPETNPLRLASGVAVRSFSRAPATVLTATAPPLSLYAAEVYQSTNVYMVFNDAMDGDSMPAPSAFRVMETPSGGGARRVTVTGVEDWAGSVMLRLDRTVSRGVTVSYTKPSVNPLRDSEGRELASFRNQPVTSGGQRQRVKAVRVSSNAGADRTYGRGEKIRVQVTFDTPVSVLTSRGTPRLRIDLDPAPGGERWADYESGRETDTLTFAYTVAGSDASSAGIAVLANRLETNGGGITSLWAWPRHDAELAHSGLGHNRAHKVDAGLPAFRSAVVDGKALSVDFTVTLDPDSLSAPGAFRVTVNGTRRSVAAGGVAISGKTVTLTLASAVTGGDTVRVRYTRPSAKPLKGTSGSAVDTFADRAVTNKTPAAFVSAQVNAATLTITFDTTLAPGSVPARGAFHVTVGSARRNVVSGGVAISGKTVRLTLASAVTSTDTVKVRYTRPSTSPLQDASTGVAVAIFADQPVTNKTPAFVSAQVNAATLTITFDTTLAPGSVPAPGAFHVTVNGTRRSVAAGGVAISGKTVTLTLASAVVPGDTVKVRYTKPSTKPLKGASGVVVETFADQEVTNNSPIWSATLTTYFLL